MIFDLSLLSGKHLFYPAEELNLFFCVLELLGSNRVRRSFGTHMRTRNAVWLDVATSPELMIRPRAA
jgi:hypothetical protein